jgi:hypothetical protein
MKRFQVKDEHIKLLRRAYVGWDDGEYGAPTIDCKRPYGNSDVEGDIGEILGIEPKHGEDGYDDGQIMYMQQLHKETATALQIFLATGEMRVGTYQVDSYSIDWKAV